MDKTLQIIEQREVLGKEFTIYGDLENPLFLAKSVAEWIEYDKSSINKMLNNVDESEKLNGTLFLSGQNREMWFLTEDGLYEVLMQSRKPIAKLFKAEVKKILKTIRLNGMYVTDKLLDNPDFAIKTFMKLKEEKEKRLQLEHEAKINKSKVIFAEAVETSKTSILIGELAKLIKQNGYDIGQKRLFAWLRENGYLIKINKRTDYNMPTQRAMDMGLFEIKETAITHSDGHISINKTVKVTGKGQIYFINKFLKVA